MLSGIPCSGKSTFVSRVNENIRPSRYSHSIVCISSDKWIDEYALVAGKTYEEVFKYYADTAHQKMFEELGNAIASYRSFIWDQTNISVDIRAKKLKKIPESYTKIAVWFPIPDLDILKERLKSRPGKSIPWPVIESMISNFQPPSIDEGFDIVIRE